MYWVQEMLRANVAALPKLVLGGEVGKDRSREFDGNEGAAGGEENARMREEEGSVGRLEMVSSKESVHMHSLLIVFRMWHHRVTSIRCPASLGLALLCLEIFAS